MPESPPELSDYETAEHIRDGKLPSPTKYGDFWLFDMRVTGTGAAKRDAKFDDDGKKIRDEEYAFRDPSKWLTDDFLKRAASVPIVFDHPKTGGLDSESYRDRAIGNMMIAYRKGDEVWGVAKIYDADAAALMQTTHRSTSPAVTSPAGSTLTTTEGGQKVLNEGAPLVLDHLAVCEQGVWDKGGEPLGIRLDSRDKEQVGMTKEEEEKLNDAMKRADAAEAKNKEYEDKTKKDSEEAEKKRKDSEEKEKADKARKDAEETERAAVEKADKKRADRSARHDSEKHEGEHNDCAKCDSMEEMDKRKDAAANVENVNANQIKELKDSLKRQDSTISALNATLAHLRKQPSIEDANEIARAFHRADSAYQMLGERVQLSLPGETPIAYRRRLADGLRKHSDRFKDQPIHDSVAGPVFALTEDAIYADALDRAKNPVVNDSVGRLREIVTNQDGRVRREFVGDPRAAWAPFMPPAHRFVKSYPQADRRSA